ncbi:MFS transporter [Tsukamurella soli]
MLTFVGHYTVYTYVSVVLVTAGARQAAIGPLLMVCGVCGLVGLWCTGRWIDRRMRATVLVVLMALAVSILGVGVAHRWLVGTVIAVAAWSGAFGGTPSMFQAAAGRAASGAPELAGAWINATSNLGIAAGALIGGSILRSGSAVAHLTLVGAVLVLTGSGVAAAARRAFSGALEGDARRDESRVREG